MDLFSSDMGRILISGFVALLIFVLSWLIAAW